MVTDNGTKDPLTLSEEELADIADLELDFYPVLPDSYIALQMAEELLAHQSTVVRASLAAKANQAVGNSDEHKRLSSLSRASATMVALIKKRYPQAVSLASSIARIRAQEQQKQLEAMLLDKEMA